MADGAPDVNAQLLQMQSLIASSQGQSGTKLNIFTPFLPDADVFSGLSSKGKGLNVDAMIRPAGQAAEGPLAKLLKQMGVNRQEIMESMKKVAQAGAVREASQAELFGQGGPAGGSFVSGVSGPSGDREIG